MNLTGSTRFSDITVQPNGDGTTDIWYFTNLGAGDTPVGAGVVARLDVQARYRSRKLQPDAASHPRAGLRWHCWRWADSRRCDGAENPLPGSPPARSDREQRRRLADIGEPLLCGTGFQPVVFDFWDGF